MTFGQIRTRAGYAYPIDEDDLLWLARAVQFEGGDHAATIWTYAQRLARAEGSSLTSLIRDHSQPVNPAWDSSDDEFCQRHPTRCTVEQLERRQRARTTPWEGLDVGVRRLVTAWATARLDNPVPRAVDFANPTVSASFLRRNPGSRVIRKGGDPPNWYIATVDSFRWPADFVSVTHEGRVATAKSGPGFVGAAILGGAVAAAGVMFWRLVR